MHNSPSTRTYSATQNPSEPHYWGFCLFEDFNYVYLCGERGLCTWVQYPMIPEEGIRSSEPEIQEDVSCLVWALGIELGSFTSAVCVLNCWALSPAVEGLLWRSRFKGMIIGLWSPNTIFCSFPLSPYSQLGQKIPTVNHVCSWFIWQTAPCLKLCLLPTPFLSKSLLHSQKHSMTERVKHV